MVETKPRDLTAAELELVNAPPQRGAESRPLTVPPGTQVPVHLLNPAAVTVAAVTPAAPTAEPPDVAASGANVPPGRN